MESDWLRMGGTYKAMGKEELTGDNLRVNDQVISIANVADQKRCIIQKAATTLFVVKAVAHRIAIGANHRQVHLRDDTWKDPLYSDCAGDDRFHALGPGLVEKGDPRHFIVRISGIG